MFLLTLSPVWRTTGVAQDPLSGKVSLMLAGGDVLCAGKGLPANTGRHVNSSCAQSIHCQEESVRGVFLHLRAFLGLLCCCEVEAGLEVVSRLHVFCLASL